MRAATILLVLLRSNGILAFQLPHQNALFARSSKAVRLGSRFGEGDSVVEGSIDFDGDSVTTTRKAFLAKALVATTTSLLLPSVLGNNVPAAYADDIAGPPAGAAIYAYRSGGLPSLRPLGITKLLTRYEGYVEAPPSYPKRGVPVAFEFPTDWLQLDKLGGGVQYVDQRNGDKLYVLRATLPEGGGTVVDLKTVPKQWFADAILSPEGDVVRSGVVAEGGRVSRSQMIVDCSAEDAPTPCESSRRRLVLKYDTVTGSGVQTVERRGLVDAYQVGGDVYMMLTTSNAVKFEQKGSKERETVENIVASFRIGAGALT